MKRLSIILSLMLSLGVASTVSAEHGEPVNGCPKPFELHHAADHDQGHEGEHRHIGSNTDRNGDALFFFIGEAG